ncbi:MAG: hypothetical protein KGJ80_14635 [Chloroflexota bacterium]|nr:hypothetical protein [Chloroflexota bacterium]
MPENSFAERAEKFYSELMREQYEVGAGLKEELDLASIYARYPDLFAEPTVRERVAAVVRDPSKSARHLADFAVSAFIENAVKELSEQITNAELKATVEWDEKQIPYQNVRAVLTREADYHRRHDLFTRQLAVMVKQNPRRVQRVSTQHDLARTLGFAGYRAMIERLRGWDLPKLSKQLDPLLAETETVFEEKLGAALSAARVPRRAADTSDVAYVLRAAEFDALFPADRLLPVFTKTIERLGLTPETTPGLKLDTEPRPRNSPRAFCAPVRVPSEVYLVIKPIGGQDDYRALFHESGHAEHFSHVDAALPFEFSYLGDEAISETFAFLFEHLTHNPRWLVDILRVPLREAERYRRFALFSKLWMLRRYAAKLRYELHLHDEGPGGMEDAYVQVLSEALHVPVPPERYLEDVDDAFYVAGYLRAWVFEVQLRHFLMEHFGEGWYESRDAGGFLQSIWSIGLRDSVDELAQTRLGAAGIEPKLLIEELADS